MGYRPDSRYRNYTRHSEIRTSKINIKTKRPVNVSVAHRKGEPTEKTIKRFIKKCKKQKIIENFREKRFYEKPSVKNRKKRMRKLAAIKKANA